MVDAALIKQCADPGLTPAIVEKFIEQAGSPDPLSVSVRSGNRVVLVPQAKTSEEAMDLIRKYAGHAVVRAGITQYPVGVGITDVSQLRPNLVDTCKNVRIGTALFSKVYRIVTKWYGTPAGEAFDDAIVAWQSGYFDGKAVFTADDPGEVKLAVPDEDTGADEPRNSQAELTEGEPPDPNKAGIRIDLSGIGQRGP